MSFYVTVFEVLKGTYYYSPQVFSFLALVPSKEEISINESYIQVEEGKRLKGQEDLTIMGSSTIYSFQSLQCN